eukprot:gene7705-7767_t
MQRRSIFHCRTFELDPLGQPLQELLKWRERKQVMQQERELQNDDPFGFSLSETFCKAINWPHNELFVLAIDFVTELTFSLGTKSLSQKDAWSDMMRAALGGDQHAYQVLLEALAKAIRTNVRASLARFGRGNADVEDIVQEVLLAVHLKKHTWDPALPFSPWVNAIARYKIADAFRRGGNRAMVQIDDLAQDIAAPETQTEDHSDAERLIGQLAPRSQYIVRTISLNGGSFSDVANELKMQEGAVRVALHRALAKLAQLYRGNTTPHAKTAARISALVLPPLALGIGLFVLLLLGFRAGLFTPGILLITCLKWAVSVPLALAGLFLALKLANPLKFSSIAVLVLGVPAVILMALIFWDIGHAGLSGWQSRMVGKNGPECLFFIPFFSTIPLAAMIYILRCGAVMRPNLAALAASLAATGIGATAYELHCTDDSPLFMGLWYVLALLIVIIIGQLFAARLLKW